MVQERGMTLMPRVIFGDRKSTSRHRCVLRALVAFHSAENCAGSSRSRKFSESQSRQQDSPSRPFLYTMQKREKQGCRRRAGREGDE
jgi:hypothetical protein